MQLEERTVRAHAGVRDDGVQAAELTHRAGNRGVHLRRVPHIACQPQGAVEPQVVTAARRARHAPALRREAAGHRGAHAATRPGDE